MSVQVDLPQDAPVKKGAWRLNRSFELHKRAARLIPGASQTTSKRPEAFAFGGFPIFLQRGSGSRVWDVDGNEYLDYIGALGPMILGYGHEGVTRAVLRQIKEGTLLSLPHPVEIEAAQALLGVIPRAEMIRFFKTGAEATSAAVRLARAITGRDRVAHCGYHGWHDLWAASGNAAGVTEGVKRDVVEFAYDDAETVRRLFSEQGKQPACVVINPVRYDKIADGLFLRHLRALCDLPAQAGGGALLIFDEIVSGFRVGLGGAQEFFGVDADLCCFGKGIANGYPVSAVTGPRDIMERMRDLQISSTYGGETLSLAALTVCVEECRRLNVSDRIACLGKQLMDSLNVAARETGVPARWDGHPAFSSYQFSYAEKAVARDAMTFWLQECARRGVLFRRGGLNFISAAHTEADIQQTVGIGCEVLRELSRAAQDGSLGERIPKLHAARGMYEV